MNELVITGYRGKKISACYENGKMTQVAVFSPELPSKIGNIYIGRVENIVKNINAAFVNIEEKSPCYLDLSTTSSPVFVKRQSEKRICMGDELLVQVIKDEVKTKAPVVTTNFSLTGRYVVLVHGGTGVQVSKKIAQKQLRLKLKEQLAPFLSEGFGLVVRTIAAEASEEELASEITKLKEQYAAFLENGIHQVRYSLLYRELPKYLLQLRDDKLKPDRIVTDLPDVLKEVTDYIQLYPCVNAQGIPTVLKQSDAMDIAINYRIEHYIDKALRRIIYLKSGATVVIDVTEALTVIDVNSGKAIAGKAIAGKKATEQTFLAINLEAAGEIARQIKLRNLSGIILIDFINMEEPENVAALLEELRKLLKEDIVQTELVDMTKLGLVEITRKKVYKTLAEQLEE